MSSNLAIYILATLSNQQPVSIFIFQFKFYMYNSIFHSNFNLIHSIMLINGMKIRHCLYKLLQVKQNLKY